MTQRRIHQLIPLVVASALGAVLACPAHADEPEGTVRYFLEIRGLVGPDFHDWEAAGSRRIVTHYEPGVTNSTWEFGYSPYAADRIVYDSDGHELLDLANTTWVQMPVLHITDDGVNSVPLVYWLVDAPDDAVGLRQLLTGNTAATGPDGDVVVLAQVGIGLGSDGLWRLSSAPIYQIRISAGLFRK